jgi:hypothetical protein
MDGSWPLEHRRPRGKESAQTQPCLMRAEHGNPVVVRRAMRAGKPIRKRGRTPRRDRMPKKQMPVAERRQENESAWPTPPSVVSYNWPDTGPGARLREQADVRQVSL